MQCGKHRGKWYNEIVAEEPDYAAWVLGLNSPGPAMEQFIDYLVKICECRKEAPDDEAVHAPDAKKPRVTPPAPPDAAAGESKQTPKLCHICYSQESTQSAFPAVTSRNATRVQRSAATPAPYARLT